MACKQLIVLTCIWAFSIVQAQKPTLGDAADILKTLKDSGMLNQFETDLKKMLFDEAQKHPTLSTNQKVSVDDSTSSSVDSFEFVKSYARERKISINDKFLLYISDLTPDTDTHRHFAQLTTLLDVVNDASTRFGKTLDTQLTTILKQSASASQAKLEIENVVRTTAIPSPKKDLPVEKPVKTSPKPETTNQVKKPTEKKLKKPMNPVIQSSVNFLEMVKNKPDMVIGIIIPTLRSYEVLSDNTLKTVDMYARMMAETEYFVTLIDVIINYVEDLSGTEFGERFATMVPKLMEAKDMNQIIEIIYKETDMNLSSFLGQVQNSDIRQKLLESMATTIVTFIDFFDHLMRDDMKLAFLNTFLVSQGFPVLNSRNLVGSAAKLSEKLLTTFTSWEVDVRQYETLIREHITTFEDNYMSWKDYKTLTELEKIRLIAQFLNDNLAEPVELLNLAHIHVTSHIDGHACAETILCHMNFRMKRSASPGGLKFNLTRGLSIFAAWAWSLDGKLNNWKLYEAIYNGANTEDCNLIYTPKDLTSCHIFPWQSTPMSLDFDRVEL